MPPSERAHRPFLIGSVLMATLVGFVLGIHVSLGRLLDSGRAERTADLVQAHGQVQLLGFAGLFVIGMSLRLMPRFAGSRIAFGALVPLTLWLFVGGLVVRAAVMPWFSNDMHSVLLIASLVAVLLGSACFILVVFGTLTVEARRFDASSLAFVLGSTFLFAASIIATLAGIEAVKNGLRDLPYLAGTAVLQMEIAFLVLFILGVALRAIPTMFGIERPGRSANLLALLVAGSSLLLSLSLLYLDYVSYTKALVVLADLGLLGFGAALLLLAWQAGALRRTVNRIRPASQTNLWLVRSAFAWMVVCGAAGVYFGFSSLVELELATQFQLDSVRHAFGAGVLTMLIAGMSMMILPEFAGERMRPNGQRLLALMLIPLLNLAALLRVLPSLVGERWSIDERNLSMAAAGSLAETAMLLFSFYLLRLFWRTRAGH